MLGFAYTVACVVPALSSKLLPFLFSLSVLSSFKKTSLQKSNQKVKALGAVGEHVKNKQGVSILNQLQDRMVCRAYLSGGASENRNDQILLQL